MANVLTNLIPSLYRNLDVVSRELVGMIPAVSMDAEASEAAVNQTIIIPVSGAETAYDASAGADIPDLGDNTIGNTTMTVSKDRAVYVRFTGEEQRGLDSRGRGPGYQTALSMRLQQAFRTLTNEMEADLYALWSQASAGVAAADTTLFKNNDYKDIANVRKLLVDAGSPGDMQLVLNTTAGARFRGNSQYYGANTSGSAEFLRQGILLQQHDVQVRESAAGKVDFVAGTAASATTNNAGYAKGATTITLASAGTGTIKAGDLVQFGSTDPTYYTVQSGDTDVSNGGTITIQEPGLRVAIPASATAITVLADASRNLCFARSAIYLLNRLPSIPVEGDKAIDSDVIVDPNSGMPFSIRVYPGRRQMTLEIAAVWGVKMVAPRHCALLTD